VLRPPLRSHTRVASCAAAAARRRGLRRGCSTGWVAPRANTSAPLHTPLPHAAALARGGPRCAVRTALWLRPWSTHVQRRAWCVKRPLPPLGLSRLALSRGHRGYPLRYDRGGACRAACWVLRSAPFLAPAVQQPLPRDAVLHVWSSRAHFCVALVSRRVSKRARRVMPLTRLRFADGHGASVPAHGGFLCPRCCARQCHGRARLPSGLVVHRAPG
jgi:hypothetical protein